VPLAPTNGLSTTAIADLTSAIRTSLAGLSSVTEKRPSRRQMHVEPQNGWLVTVASAQCGLSTRDAIHWQTPEPSRRIG
jgi:hypothetical protein